VTVVVALLGSSNVGSCFEIHLFSINHLGELGGVAGDGAELSASFGG